MAPTRTQSGRSSIPRSVSMRLMSIRAAGLLTRMFSIGISDCPPASI
ncbi:MAG: hypothetical protein H3C55_03830 [Pseudorhodoplanes sp.]|nr:hypothetical protein [Pseudorhodoplanes sp.]